MTLDRRTARTDRVTDLFAIARGGVLIAALIGTARLTAAEPELFPGAQYTAGSYCQAETAGDFDGDGDLDIATVHGLEGVVSVLLNNGNGSFAEPVVYPGGQSPTSIISGDFDGDGDVDLAAASSYQSSDYVAILLNHGDGVFSDPITYPAGNGPDLLVAGDLDGDGDLDIATQNRSAGQVTVLLNLGDGAFAAPVSYTAGVLPAGLVTADLDGDGDLDLATPNKRKVGVLLNHGDGTFAPTVEYRVIEGMLAISAADLDADGDVDLVTSGAQVSVLRNNGDGSFASHVDYDAGPAAGSLTVGDLDHDGDADLVLAGGNTQQTGGFAVVLLNDGNAMFDSFATYTAGRLPSSVLVADLDFDGNLDVSVAGDAVTILLGNGDGTLSSARPWPVGQSPAALAAGDLDTDGDIDLVTANVDSDDISVLLNLGDGTFADHIAYAGAQAPRSVAISDMDDDHDLDVVVANRDDDTVSVWLNQGDATLSNGGSYATGRRPISVAAADFDGDGDIDLAAANSDCNNVSVLMNYGDGSFAQGIPHRVWNSPTSVTAADFDGDGHPDLAATLFYSGAVSVLLNEGDGTFLLRVNYGLEGDPMGIAAADLDGDGDIDLATANRDFEGSVSIFANRGSGAFTHSINYAAGAKTNGLAVADLDGDGRLDIVVANYDGENVSALMQRDDGTFQPPKSFAVGFQPQSVVVQDLDGDGDLDLAVANTGGNNVAVLLNLNEPPIALCRNVTVPADDSCSANVDPNEVDDGSFDPDGGLVIVHLDPAGPYRLGETPVTFTVTDGRGAFDACAATIHVVDQTAPAVECPPDVNLRKDDPLDPNATGWATAIDNCDFDVSIEYTDRIREPNCPANSALRIVTRTWTAADAAGNAATCDQTIRILKRALPLDVKPRACPNRLNPNSRGILPVAILGSADFSVKRVDLFSVRLSRLDRPCRELVCFNDPPEVQSAIVDVGRPYAGQACDCDEAAGDGYLDLLLNFKTQSVVSELLLGELPNEAEVELIVYGQLDDGSPFVSRDCIQLTAPGSPITGVEVQSPLPDEYYELTPPDELFDAGGFGSFVRSYLTGEIVTLIASPTSDRGVPFVGWHVDGVLSRQPAVEIKIGDGIRIAEAVYCLGDLNSDWVIDLTDLATLLQHYGEPAPDYARGDITGDGTVDLDDLGVMLSDFGLRCE